MVRDFEWPEEGWYRGRKISSLAVLTGKAAGDFLCALLEEFGLISRRDRPIADGSVFQGRENLLQLQGLCLRCGTDQRLMGNLCSFRKR